METNKRCGDCNFWKEGRLIRKIGQCFITNETKKEDEYCTKGKREYFRPKGDNDD